MTDNERKALEKALGYTFKDIALLKTALTHRSFLHEPGASEDTTHPRADNQRLEFLGDSVLNLCVSVFLYRQFSQLREGELSKMRAGLVNDAQLAQLGRKLGLPACLFLGRGEETTGGRDKTSILADAFEAVIAAVFLDGSFGEALEVVGRLMGRRVSQSSTRDFLQDHKTTLQELTQERFGHAPEYRLSSATGPDHAKVFEVTLKLGELKLSVGKGRSKKEAEREAAKAALAFLHRELGAAD